MTGLQGGARRPAWQIWGVGGGSLWSDVDLSLLWPRPSLQATRVPQRILSSPLWGHFLLFLSYQSPQREEGSLFILTRPWPPRSGHQPRRQCAGVSGLLSCRLSVRCPPPHSGLGCGAGPLCPLLQPRPVLLRRLPDLRAGGRL